jgi:hypothetical protein
MEATPVSRASLQTRCGGIAVVERIVNFLAERDNLYAEF